MTGICRLNERVEGKNGDKSVLWVRTALETLGRSRFAREKSSVLAITREMCLDIQVELGASSWLPVRRSEERQK